MTKPDSLLDAILENSWLIGLTVLGAIFRFAELGSVRLSHDLAWQAWDAARIINGVYPLIGQPSSVFLDNPPLMGYLQAIPLFFWRSPWSIFIFVTLLNSLAVPFLFSAVDQTLGRRVAILSTVLFAFNPWIVHFSRMTWTQGLLPFFLAIIFWCWVPILLKTENKEEKSRSFDIRFLVGWIALAAMLQTYILAFIALAPMGLILLVYWRNVPKRELWMGMAFLALTLLFYTWSVNQNLDQNSSKFFDFVTELGGASETDPEEVDSDQVLNLTDDALVHAMRLITGRDFVGQDVNGPISLDPIPVPIVSQLARWLFSAAFLAGLVVLFTKPITARWLLLIWFFVPIVLMMLLPSSVFVHPHYLLFTLPVGGIITALGLDWAMQQHRSIVWIGGLLLLAIGAQFKASLWQSGQAVSEQPYALGLNGVPLRLAAQAGSNLTDLSPSQVPLRVVSAANDQIVTAMSGRWVDVVEGANQPGLMLAQTGLDTPILSLPDEDGEVFWSMGPTESVMRVIENRVEIESDAGISLIGYSHSQNDEQLTLSTFWRIDVLHDARNEWFVSPFVHGIDGNGQTIINQAPHPVWGYQWRVGDVYISTVEIEMTADFEKLGFGLFDPISQQTFLLKAEDGSIPRYEVDFP